MTSKTTAARRPRLTAKVIRGLDDIYCVASAELEAGEDGAFGRTNGGPEDGGAAALSGIRYIRQLVQWHEARKP